MWSIKVYLILLENIVVVVVLLLFLLLMLVMLLFWLYLFLLIPFYSVVVDKCSSEAAEATVEFLLGG